jgi:trehalose-phosphatase
LNVSKALIENYEHLAFFKNVAKAETRVLILDYDGTVAPFSADRKQALPYPGIPQLLQSVMTSCGTRLIVVSGRAAHEVPPLLGFRPLPEIWGTHGVERISREGRYEQVSCSDDALNVLAQAETLLERRGLGSHLEIKLAAVAVHWRGLSPAKVLTVRTKAYRTLEPLANHPDLVLMGFEEGVEIRLRAANKGNVIRTLLSELDADVPIAYLGDDSTDEEAFRALNTRGLTVLVRPKQRFTAAQIWLKPPDELREFLTTWIRFCGGSA